jgi:hypothetical protein
MDALFSGMDPNTRLLAEVLEFVNWGIDSGKPPGATSPPLSPEFLKFASDAAAGILATASPNFAKLSPISPALLRTLQGWAAGHFEPNEIVRPQLIASTLLFADVWKQGS